MAKRRKKQNLSWLWMVIAGGALLLISAITLFFVANQGPAGQAPTTPVASNPDDGVERISLQDAKAAFDNSSAVFLDVRTDTEYEQSHIPGAVLIPLNQLPSRLAELDPASNIITYCT